MKQWMQQMLIQNKANDCANQSKMNLHCIIEVFNSIFKVGNGQEWMLSSTSEFGIYYVILLTHGSSFIPPIQLFPIWISRIILQNIGSECMVETHSPIQTSNSLSCLVPISGSYKIESTISNSLLFRKSKLITSISC